MQYVAEQFWKRWLREYLPTLIRRTKWLKEDKNVEIGDLVMLQEDNVKRGSWPLGRIENIYPVSDGVVQIVDVRTKSGVYSRPVVKIYPLEDRYVDEVPQGGGNVEDKIHKKDIKNKK